MHLDTHAVIWLHEGDLGLFPAAVRRRLEAEPLAVSPVVRFELTLLREIGRVTPSPDVLLGDLARSIGLTVSPASFTDVVGAAATLSWTRDPFDRLICAQAIVDNADLLTKDRRIRKHFDCARWD